MGTCRECRWWAHPSTEHAPGPWERCLLAGIPGGKMIAGPLGSGATVKTHETFGCVLWEAYPEPAPPDWEAIARQERAALDGLLIALWLGTPGPAPEDLTGLMRVWTGGTLRALRAAEAQAWQARAACPPAEA